MFLFTGTVNRDNSWARLDGYMLGDWVYGDNGDCRG